MDFELTDAERIADLRAQNERIANLLEMERQGKRQLERNACELDEENERLKLLIEQEREDYFILEDKLNDTLDKLEDLLTIAMCMMDSKKAGVLRDHAKILGIELEANI